MAFKDTFFDCLDNTGAVSVRCLKVFGSDWAKPGSLVVVVVKKAISKRKVKKGQIFKALVVRLKQVRMRLNGFKAFYNQNAIVILKKTELVPLGTRVIGSVFLELRVLGYLKIVSLASFII